MVIQQQDTILIEEFRSGGQKAFKRIYDLHSRSLVYFAEALVADRQQAEDIVAEIFIKLHKLRENFHELQNIRSFLYLATRNLCLDYLRAAKRKGNNIKELQYLSEGEEESYLDTIIESEFIGKLYAVLESLPKECKKIMKLAFLEGFSNKEIADKLGLSISSVKNQKVRGLQLMRIRLDVMVTFILIFLIRNMM